MVGLRLVVEMLSLPRLGGDDLQQGHRLALGQRWRGDARLSGIPPGNLGRLRLNRVIWSEVCCSMSQGAPAV
jgi:hypothetical protein